MGDGLTIKLCPKVVHLFPNMMIKKIKNSHFLACDVKNVEKVEQAGNGNFSPGDDKLSAEKNLTTRLKKNFHSIIPHKISGKVIKFQGRSSTGWLTA